MARGELDLTIGLLQAAPNGEGRAEAVHEARKALKRLRALLRVSRPALEERRYRRENVVFRDAGRELSDARDAQVLLETLDSLLERFGDELPPRDLGPPAWRARGRRRCVPRPTAPPSYDEVLAVLTRARTPRLRLAAAQRERPRLAGRRVSSGSTGAVGAALRRAKADPTPENLHELRKRAKDLWHAAQLLEPVCPDEMKPLAKSAHQLSNLLGDDHDLSVLLEYADEHPELLDEGEHELLHKLADRRRKSLRRQALACAGGSTGASRSGCSAGWPSSKLAA